MQGEVKRFDKTKGYGFILGEDNQEYFFHYSQLIMDGYKTVRVAQKVTFTPEQGEKGLRASEIHLIY